MKNDELSYKAHKNNLKSKIDENDERLMHIKNKNCISYQLKKRTLDSLKPFLNSRDEWLTVGDYNGLEANYLIENGQKVIASDLTDVFLKEAKNDKLINDYKIINVENIDYPDNSFDYTICKEAFHHFPKAYIGLYEMIRCSRKAAIIIEPIDVITKMPLLLFIKNVLDRINPMLINKIWKNRFSFEIVGNYVFKISEREVEKIAMGLGLNAIAFKRVNLILNPGLKKSVMNENPINMKAWRKVKQSIRLKNFFSFLKIVPYNHLLCMVFKSSPSAEVRKNMKKMGYVIIDLPKNPYITNMANKM